MGKSRFKIVALSGWKGSGKDAAAEVLIDTFLFTRYAFADNLKELAASEYGIPVEDTHSRDKKEAIIKSMPVLPKDDFTMGLYQLLEGEFPRDENGMPHWSPRALCILKGSVNRLVDPNYWVNSVAAAIEKDGSNAVITDMRYQNEMDVLRERFGDRLITVRVNRFESTDSTDPSERDLDNAKFDVILDNVGTLEEFREMVKTVGRIAMENK